MSNDRTVTMRIPETLLAAAFEAARHDGMTTPDFIRAAIADRVAEFGGKARDPLAALRRRLRRDFGAADGWVDLQRRLRGQGLVLRVREEGEVWLHTWPVERRLVPLDRLGTTCAELVLLYRAPFPADGREAPRPKPVAQPAARLFPFPVRRAA
ncbi:MAG: hypothetical protein MUE98_10955 [Rhodobacteraceae bacterium]|jgi:hypothetical protein|nr:hypothetical protein [Paracoccaceae bacterium]